MLPIHPLVVVALVLALVMPVCLAAAGMAGARGQPTHVASPGGLSPLAHAAAADVIDDLSRAHNDLAVALSEIRTHHPPVANPRHPSRWNHVKLAASATGDATLLAGIAVTIYYLVSLGCFS